MSLTRLLPVAALAVLGALASPTAAQALDYASVFQATLSGSERQEWRVVGDATGAPCAPVGSGTQVLTLRAARPVTVSFHQELRGAGTFFLSRIPVAASVSRVDNTTLTPPADPGDSCSHAGEPKDCGTHSVARVAVTGGAKGTRGRLEVGGPFDLSTVFVTCFAPESQPGSRDFKDATASWPRFGALFRAGSHRLTATRRLPPHTFRDSAYGEVEQTSTVTWTLTLKLSPRRAVRCRGIRFKTCL